MGIRKRFNRFLNMELIDKAAIAAEIERIKEDGGIGLDAYGMGKDNGKLEACDKLLSFIDSIETKDVDLEKEIDSLWNPRFNLGWDEKSLLSINHEGFSHIAKHFFNLGLKAGRASE